MEGNQMKMRDALDEIIEKIDKWRTDGLMEHWQYSQLFDIADAALSAPARNCDIYTTSEDADRAITEYCSKMAETGECVKSCPHREAEGGCAFGWLLATAAERKGEGDGSK